MSEAPSTHASRLHLPSVLIAAAVAAVTLDGAFVFDDVSAILHNDVVLGRVPWYAAFERSFWGDPIGPSGVDTYRPLGTLHLRLLYACFGASPLGFRCVTVALHAMAAALAHRLLLRFGHPREVADAGALLFAAHAVHAQALGMIVGQVDVLASVLGMLAVLVAWSRARGAWPAAAAILLVACLVKESAFVYGVALVLAQAVPGLDRRERLRALPVLAVVVLMVALQLALPRMPRIWSQGLVYASSGPTRVALGLAWLAKGAALCVAPMDLVPSHGYAELDPSFGTLALPASGGAVVLLLGTVLLGRALLRGARDRVVLLVLLFAPLLLISGLVVKTPTDLPERLLYGPSFAVSALAAIALPLGMPDASRRRVALVALVAVLCLGGAVAQRPWVSTRALADYAVETSPEVMHHHAYRAIAAMDDGAYDVASYELGLAAWLFNRYPRPVDWSVVERYEARHPPHDWLDLPTDLFGGDPCRSVVGLLHAAHGQAPRLEPHMLAGFVRRHPSCFAPR